MSGLGMIWAQDVTGILGADGGMLWRVPSDFAHFKATTMGCGLVMGRTTWESLGGPLPGRRNVVLTHDPQAAPPGSIPLTRIVTQLGGQALGSQREPLAQRAGADRALGLPGPVTGEDHVAPTWQGSGQ